MEIINHKSDALSYQDEVFNELYYTKTLVEATKTCCQDREFKGQYYGIPQNYIPMISDERNEYISLLTLISDKLKNMHKLNLCLEKEICCLHESYNRSR